MAACTSIHSIMLRHVVLIGLFFAGTQGSFPGTHGSKPAPLKWGGSESGSFFVAPVKTPSGPAQTLAVRDIRGMMFPGELPYFTANPDNTITWDEKGLCLEAIVESHVPLPSRVRVNHCNGGPHQRWEWLPWGAIRLENTNQCLDVLHESALDGAQIELRECANRMSEAWKFEDPSLFEAQRPAIPVSMRHVMRVLAVMVAVGILSLGAWLWPQRVEILPVARSQPCHGGVCLTETLDVQVPAVMAVNTSGKVATVAPGIEEHESEQENNNCRAPLPPPSSFLPVRIDGIWYDCASWADKHPGGRWMLEYARGRDVTALYHATHMWGNVSASKSLARLPKIAEADLPLPSRTGLPPSLLKQEEALQGPFVVELDESHSSPLPPIHTPLRQELQAMLHRRFPTRASTKATAGHWVRTIVAGILCVSCWAGWLRFDPLSILLLPLAQWVLAAHTVHEATHGALSTNPRVNFWFQFTSHPILFNVFVWIPQHLLSHHQYTNDPQHDVDVHHFAAARLATAQQPYVQADRFNHGWTFVWKGCLTTVGTCILQPLRTLVEKPTPNFDANLTPVPAAVSKRTLLISMLPSFFVLFYPLIAAVSGAAAGVPLPLLALAEVWPWVGMSIIWTLMTQTSHVQASCQPDNDLAANEPDCWTARQIGTALDYSVGSPLATALTAGLNNQGMHHAMPTISMSHFPAIYREYEDICRRHGVSPRQTRDLVSATREMLEYIFDLNDPSNSSPDSSQEGASQSMEVGEARPREVVA